MVNNLSCSFCRKSFLDGEIVAIYSSDEIYHTFVRTRRFESCLKKHLPLDDEHKLNYASINIVYENKFYPTSYIDGEANSHDLINELYIDINEEYSGDIINSSLDDLLRVKHIILK